MVMEKNIRMKHAIAHGMINTLSTYGAGATIKQIAKATDVTPGVIHYYYTNKKAILKEAMEIAARLLVFKIDPLDDDSLAIVTSPPFRCLMIAHTIAMVDEEIDDQFDHCMCLLSSELQEKHKHFGEREVYNKMVSYVTRFYSL